MGIKRGKENSTKGILFLESVGGKLTRVKLSAGKQLRRNPSVRKGA